VPRSCVASSAADESFAGSVPPSATRRPEGNPLRRSVRADVLQAGPFVRGTSRAASGRGRHGPRRGAATTSERQRESPRALGNSELVGGRGGGAYLGSGRGRVVRGRGRRSRAAACHGVARSSRCGASPAWPPSARVAAVRVGRRASYGACGAAPVGFSGAPAGSGSEGGCGGAESASGAAAAASPATDRHALRPLGHLAGARVACNGRPPGPNPRSGTRLLAEHRGGSAAAPLPASGESGFAAFTLADQARAGAAVSAQPAASGLAGTPRPALTRLSYSRF